MIDKVKSHIESHTHCTVYFSSLQTCCTLSYRPWSARRIKSHQPTLHLSPCHPPPVNGPVHHIVCHLHSTVSMQSSNNFGAFNLLSYMFLCQVLIYTSLRGEEHYIYLQILHRPTHTYDGRSGPMLF